MTRGLKGFAVEGPDPELRVDGSGGMIGTSATCGGSEDVEGGIGDGDNVGHEAMGEALGNVDDVFYALEECGIGEEE